MQKLTDRLEQDWQTFHRRWDCQQADNYGKSFVSPMMGALADFEKSADLLMDAALELNAALSAFERQEGGYL